MTPRRCARCGREVADWVVHRNDADHGPIEVTWCADADTCEAARKATPRQSSIWLGRAAGHNP